MRLVGLQQELELDTDVLWKEDSITLLDKLDKLVGHHEKEDQDNKVKLLELKVIDYQIIVVKIRMKYLLNGV